MDRNRGVAAVFTREWRRMLSQRFYPLFLIVLPLLSFAVLWAIFQQQVPRGLPVVICDEDDSALSRRITRMIAATPSMSIVAAADDFSRGQQPHHGAQGLCPHPDSRRTEREVDRGMTAEIACFYNAQIHPSGKHDHPGPWAGGGNARRGHRHPPEAGADGESGGAARAHAEPIHIAQHALFNPQLNYVYFLLTALLPTMLQIFILLTAVQAIGSELKEKTAQEWLAVSGFSPWRAVWINSCRRRSIMSFSGCS